ncbi:MAG TPA: DMT family transporter [Bryobacteraceae bacterium]|nr:DMT family transporter [Bryobacteraceae bacterium]HOQ47120.1 DMT family transporter [Bryobacteraceae bacterium]HPQ15897.1 DMT family transporter [Bryobacteraceae bacterium]HPU72487.1 DMT family transporter [Bryobacteraceae bacterium]
MIRNGREGAWRADLALVFIALIWGSTFVVVKEALADTSTLLFLALRFSLATVSLGLVFRPLPGTFARRTPWMKGGVLAGLCLFGGYAFQTFGLRYTTPSKSAFITGLAIVMVPVLAGVVQRKVPHPSEAIGVAVATAGLALLTMPAGSLHMEKGDLLTLACAVAFAAHILVVGYYAPKIGFQALTLVQLATTAAMSLAGFWWLETPFIRWSAGVVAAVIVTGLLATALAFSVQTWAQQYTTPTRTALILALEPVFAWVTSFVVTGEVLSRKAALGAALILSGILLVELKPFALRRPPA